MLVQAEHAEQADSVTTGVSTAGRKTVIGALETTGMKLV